MVLQMQLIILQLEINTSTFVEIPFGLVQVLNYSKYFVNSLREISSPPKLSR